MIADKVIFHTDKTNSIFIQNFLTNIPVSLLFKMGISSLFTLVLNSHFINTLDELL